MTPAEAIQQARAGKLLPLYLVVGEERWFRDEVETELRSAALAGSVAAFNEDRFTAGDAGLDIDAVVMAARTVPMMAVRRFVAVRGAERWDGSEASVALDRLAEYAENPVQSTCLVVVASKIDGRRRLTLLAKKQGFLVTCDGLPARAVPAWIVHQCAQRGHGIGQDVAELLAALVGTDLSSLHDGIERLSLYVGDRAIIDETAVSACISRIRTDDTWALVDAVGSRNLGRALSTLADAYDPRDRGLPILGALAWSVRQLARYQAALAAGSSAAEAARRAGVFQPNRASELAAKARAARPQDVERWIVVLAETDVALKSSRRPANAILEEMLTRLCRAKPRGSAPTI